MLIAPQAFLSRLVKMAPCWFLLFVGGGVVPAADPDWRIAFFSADVTPPLGHPCMGGGIAPAQRIDDPLFANGFVLLGDAKPIVLVAIDWCEIRNDAYERWREVLAAAANTDKERILVSTLHQHDAPIADLTAQKLLDKAKAKGAICNLEFHEQAVQRVAKALKNGLTKPRRITHLGIGQAKVEKVASNRRYLADDGTPRFGRMSATRDPEIRAKPEGVIDPCLKTLSFWDGDQPVVAISGYATHPMSYYGKGSVSADFVGLARKRRQSDDPKVMQIYVSGCSGNVTAGKYNDGSPENRPILADRIYQAMTKAWQDTKRVPLPPFTFRSTKMRLEPRDDPGFTLADLEKRLETDARPFGQCLAALGLSWRLRADQGATIDVPALDWGKATLVLMPAESYVEFQLAAQKLRPDDFVLVLGYGECAPGYIPTEKHVAEKDGNLGDWNWVAPGSEPRMLEALRRVLLTRSETR
jgi:hypothetical protein